MNPSKEEIERHNESRRNVSDINEYGAGKYHTLFHLLVQLYRKLCYEYASYESKASSYKESYIKKQREKQESSTNISGIKSAGGAVKMGIVGDMEYGKGYKSYKSHKGYKVPMEGCNALSMCIKEIAHILIQNGVPESELDKVNRYEKHCFYEDRNDGVYKNVFQDDLNVPKLFK